MGSMLGNRSHWLTARALWYGIQSRGSPLKPDRPAGNGHTRGGNQISELPTSLNSSRGDSRSDSAANDNGFHKSVTNLLQIASLDK